MIQEKDSEPLWMKDLRGKDYLRESGKKVKYQRIAVQQADIKEWTLEQTRNHNSDDFGNFQ